MTELLYPPDNDYETSFSATATTVTSSDRDRCDGVVVLDKTLFYKEGGGQPADHGDLRFGASSCDVVDVQKDHGEVRHFVRGDVPSEGETVSGEIDWDRRYAHMRMHTAQHVVSWEALQLFDASTAGNQIHASKSRIDLAPVSLDDEDIKQLESAVNDVIDEDRDVVKEEMSRDVVESRVVEGRTNLELIPDSVDPLRVVEIGGVDLCPCGGTHVDRTGEIGGVRMTGVENKGAETERVRFELVSEG
jgi:misacylated tRNA(Ala) deacylase